MEQSSKPMLMEEQRNEAELQRLKEELLELREKRRWPWLFLIVISAMLVSLIAGFAGYLLRDSLEARRRTETRKNILNAYFAIDDKNAGGRKQSLSFIKQYLAKDDPELFEWVKKESVVVDEKNSKMKEETVSHEEETKRTRFYLEDKRGLRSPEEDLRRDVRGTILPLEDIKCTKFELETLENVEKRFPPHHPTVKAIEARLYLCESPNDLLDLLLR